MTPWTLPIVLASLSASFTLPDPIVTGYEYEWADQPVLIEVWIEKTAMDDILEPLCRRALATNSMTLFF
jgi:hypothetical protein